MMAMSKSYSESDIWRGEADRTEKAGFGENAEAVETTMAKIVKRKRAILSLLWIHSA